MTGKAAGPVLLGLDIGTSRTKAALVDRAGDVQGRSAVPTPFVRRETGAVEMTTEALLAAVRQAIVGLGPPVGAVAAAGVTGLAESGAAMRAGRALAPIPAWFDGRGEEVAGRLAGPSHAGLARRIGQRPRSVSSVAKLGSLLAAGVPVPDRWLGVPELVLFELTGVEATDWSLAARTGALDIVDGTWIEEVCAEIGVPTSVWVPPQRAGDVMGWVTPAAAAAFGLPAGVPVTVAGHDHLAAAEAVVGADELGNSVGTAETVLRRCARAPDLARALELGVAVTRRPRGDGWVVLASAARSGQALTELATWLDREPHDLDRLASTDRSSAGEQWGAELDRLAARTAEAAGRITALTGAARSMVVFGGGSASAPWLAAKAHRLRPLPVRRCPVPDAAAYGAARAAGVAAGWWPHPGAEAAVPGQE